MRILTLILFIGISYLGLMAQNEANIWYFGDHAGLDFSDGEPQLLFNSAMRAEAGCAVINNSEGELLFYTNGKNVWNRKHEQMPNGYGLNGSQILNQNSIIVPLPDSDSIYYLFTINANYDSLGMNYSIVNMNRESGLGDIVLRNQLMTKSFVEKIAATEHCNGQDIWIVAHNRLKSFYSYLLTPEGIFQDTVISKTGNYIRGDIGYMKISPASNRIAFPLNNDSLLVEVFKFDNRSGVVSEPLKIFAIDETVYAYGLEFSPDGNLLYLSTGGKEYRLWQYDLTRITESAINESATLLANGNHFAMQLAPNGKLYIAKQNRDYLSVINYPNMMGYNCGYQEFALSLQGNNSLMGLPNFMSSMFYQAGFSYKNTCLGDTSLFLYNQYINSDSVVWNFGDGSSPFVSTNNALPKHVYKSTGKYMVELYAYHCNNLDTVIRELELFEYPKIDLGDDTSICNSCYITLDGGEGMDYWLWQDGSESRYYKTGEAGAYTVWVSKDGCHSSDTIWVSKSSVVLSMPNAFTPNKDGINDYFKAIYNQPPDEHQLMIYDRQSRLLFQSGNVNEGWDGKYLGVRCMGGVYIYKVVYLYIDENKTYQHERHGSLLLVR